MRTWVTAESAPWQSTSSAPPGIGPRIAIASPVHLIELTDDLRHQFPAQPVDGRPHLVLARRALAHQILQRLEQPIAVVADRNPVARC